MRSRIGAGVLAGLLAGLVFGILMQTMTMPALGDGSMAMPSGGHMPMAPEDRVPMITMMARVLRSQSLVIGWIYVLVGSAVIGGIYGRVLGGRATKFGPGLAWGALYGIIVWFLGALILMPVLLGMSPFAPLTSAPMRPSTMASLGAHVLAGLILGAVFAFLYRGPAASEALPGA
jgi:hypothetical protein